MKKLLGLLIVILVGLTSDLPAQNSVVILPDSIALRVMEDLLLSDHLKVQVNLQDSIIRVYELRDTHYQQIIASYKVSEEQYQLIIGNMEKINKIQDAKMKDQIKLEKKRKRKTLLVDALQTFVILLLTYSLITK